MPRRAGRIDEVIEDKGVKLLIDPTAVMFLLGTEMDYQSDRMRSGFVFNNPNQTSACGCGEWVSLHPRRSPEKAQSAPLSNYSVMPGLVRTSTIARAAVQTWRPGRPAKTKEEDRQLF